MLNFSRILVSTLVLGVAAASLSACGQQGPLYLPTERATVPRAAPTSSPALSPASAATAPSP